MRSPIIEEPQAPTIFFILFATMNNSHAMIKRFGGRNHASMSTKLEIQS